MFYDVTECKLLSYKKKLIPNGVADVADHSGNAVIF